MNNKQRGTAFEKEFCGLLKSRGFWVHFMSPSASGAQPCDIIACRNNIPYLFDCKTCEKDTFHISRLEDNQLLAFQRFDKTGNDLAFVAVKHDKKVYLIQFFKLLKLQNVKLTAEFLADNWEFWK